MASSYFLYFKVACLEMRKHRFKNFSGLYGQTNVHASPFYVFSELIEDRSKSFDWNIEAHLHPNLYQFFLIQSGTVAVETSTGKCSASSGSVICIPPGSIHGFVFTSNIKGRIISVADSVIEEILKGAPHILLMVTGNVVVHKIKEKPLFKELVEIASRIQKEHHVTLNECEMAVQAWLQLMLVKLYRLLETSERKLGGADRSEQYFIAFMNSVKSSSPFSKTAKDYASELHITPVHLNRICQAVAGKTSSWLIQELSVREAQKLLRYSTLSISQIAYQLNFTTANYFARLFKKHTGKTPEAYRKPM